MKVPLLVFVVCTHTFCITDGILHTTRGIDGEAIITAVKNKCVTDENLQQLKIGAEQLATCVSRSLPDHLRTFDPLQHLEEYCSYYKDGEFRTCLKNFTTNSLSPCLTENEKYIENFIFSAFDVALEDLCGINGASNIQYLFNKDNGTADCMLSCTPLYYRYGTCTSALNIFKHLNQGLLNFNKNDVCHDLESLQKCTTHLFEVACNGNGEYSRFSDLFFGPFLKGCDDVY